MLLNFNVPNQNFLANGHHQRFFGICFGFFPSTRQIQGLWLAPMFPPRTEPLLTWRFLIRGDAGSSWGGHALTFLVAFWTSTVVWWQAFYQMIGHKRRPLLGATFVHQSNNYCFYYTKYDILVSPILFVLLDTRCELRGSVTHSKCQPNNICHSLLKELGVVVS